MNTKFEFEFFLLAFVVLAVGFAAGWVFEVYDQYYYHLTGYLTAGQEFNIWFPAFWNLF
jgi:hypothetical protein